MSVQARLEDDTSELLRIVIALMKEASDDELKQFYSILKERAKRADLTNEFHWIVQGSYTHSTLLEHYGKLREQHGRALTDLTLAQTRVAKLENALSIANLRSARHAK